MGFILQADRSWLLMGTEASCILIIIETKRMQIQRQRRLVDLVQSIWGRSWLFLVPERSMLSNLNLNPKKRRDCRRIKKREYGSSKSIKKEFREGWAALTAPLRLGPWVSWEKDQALQLLWQVLPRRVWWRSTPGSLVQWLTLRIILSNGPLLD